MRVAALQQNPDVLPAGAPGTWIATLARAIPALALGLVITFSSDHSAEFGLICFGVFAILTGAVQLASALRALRGRRSLFLVQAVVTLLAGIAALVLPTGGVGYLVWVVSAWAIIVGAIELVNGLMSRGRVSAARDWILTGAFTLFLGLALVLIPRDLVQNFTGPDHVARALTAAIVDVGILGAWAAIVGVQLAIATVTLRSASRARQQVTA